MNSISQGGAPLSGKEPESVTISQHEGSAFLSQGDMPWTPWVMEETWFRLLSVNPVSGGFSMMLKVGPHNVAPIHGHVGLVEGMILEGGFSYEDDHGHAGDYVCEPAGINHKPTTGADGMVMFAVVHGPLLGYAEDGSVAMVVDAKVMYEMAEKAGAASHIARPAHWDAAAA